MHLRTHHAITKVLSHPAVSETVANEALRVGKQITTLSSLTILTGTVTGDMKTDTSMATAGTDSITCTETVTTGCYTGSYIPNITLEYTTTGADTTEYTTRTHTTGVDMSL